MANVRVVVIKSFTDKTSFTRLKGKELVLDEGYATALAKAGFVKTINNEKKGEKNETRG